MTVRELKKELEQFDDNLEVEVEVRDDRDKEPILGVEYNETLIL